MIALDTNILVYAFQPVTPWHERANERLRELLEGPLPWALPWAVAHEFVAVVTQPRIWERPATPGRAVAALRAWTAAPGARMLAEGDAHLDRFGDLLGGDVRGARVFDARIAAICLDNGIAELWSADRDFSRWPALRVTNPLVVAA